MYERTTSYEDKLKIIKTEYEGKKSTYNYFNDVIKKIKKTEKKHISQDTSDSSDSSVRILIV